MKRTLAILITIIVWGGIIFYLAWSSRLGKERRAEVIVESLVVDIADSAKVSIINAHMVEEWIKKMQLDPLGKQIDEVNTRAISEAVKSHDFVKDVNTFVDLNGRVTVRVWQLNPIMRFITENGHDAYYTEEGYIVPVSKRSARYVPVVTGTFKLPFDKGFSGNLEAYISDNEKKSDKNYLFISKLINFVEYIGSDKFWSSQIVQINLQAPTQTNRKPIQEPEIELIPRIGDHVIMFGTLEGYKGKLGKLNSFYEKALNKEGWSKWNYINLKYDGQVVCSNK